MTAEGTFIFKGTQERKGGSFINEKGKEVKYSDATIVKFDEEKNGIIYDRQIKVLNDNVSLLAKISQIKPYSPVIMTFSVDLYQKSCILNLEDIILVND